jgi:tight adherence protein C
MIQILLNYPEFIVGILLSALWLLSNRQTTSNNNNLLTVLAGAAGRRLPAGYGTWLSQQQYLAGLRDHGGTGNFFCWKIYPSMGCLLLAFLVPVPLWLVLFLSILVFFASDLWLIAKVAKRKKLIAEGLPQALDLMLLCVDAGLGLDASVQRIAQEKTLLSSELSTELDRLSRDILLGMDRESAYWSLYTRTGVDEVRSLSAAINQSQKLGLSISSILRAQSDFLRYRQQKRAEERSARLPVWMAFPLWFCIMPALLLVLVGPSLLLFLNQVHTLPPGF